MDPQVVEHYVILTLETAISGDLFFNQCFTSHLCRIRLVGSLNFMKLWDPPGSAARLEATQIVRAFSASNNPTDENVLISRVNGAYTQYRVSASRLDFQWSPDCAGIPF